MKPEDLDRIKEVLEEALKLDPTERQAYVAKVCVDETIRREVESLLEQDGVETNFLETPLCSLRSEEPEDSGNGLRPGQRIGPYQVVEKLGEGGMGAVALAVREDDFEKRVALKIVRLGILSGDLVRRFHNERQILARLEHPNIAHILDGGTTADGRPYFVMEYVEGEPIDEYCDRHTLSIRQRLELLCQVCSALQVAHQNLVVHRDLKPSNILVTEDGIPKLLDFGIAKQLAPPDRSVQPAPVQTRFPQQPLTLPYASPEQIEERPITTASDVYSLGVLLYQLLTGRSPYRPRSERDSDLAQAIRSQEPLKPSTAVRKPDSGEASSRLPDERRRLRRLIAGDLDSIVLKALQKEASKRYGSVEQLSQDVRRYLEGRPVLAREGTFAYRTGKFVRRHKLRLAAAVLVLLGFLASAVSWRQALRERELRHEFVTFLDLLFLHSASDVPLGQGLMASERLAHVEEKFDELDAEPPLRAEILESMSRIYAERGRYGEARAPLEKALAIRRLHPEDRTRLARAINNLASLSYSLGQEDEAEKLWGEALAMKRELGDEDVDVTKTMNNLAVILMNRGRYAQAEELYREALTIRREAYGPGDPDVAISLRHLGNLFYVRGHHGQAEPLLRQALGILRRVRGDDHPQVALVLSSLGRVLQAQGRYGEAKALYTDCLRIRRARYRDDHPHVAAARRDLAGLHYDLGEPDVAEAFLDQALAVIHQSAARDSWELAEAESLVGALRTTQGRYEEAESLLAKSYEILREKRGEEAIYTKRALRRLDDLYAAWGRPVPERFNRPDDPTSADRDLPHRGESPPEESTAPGSGS